MDHPLYQTDMACSLSPISELSSCMQGLQCQDSSSPRRLNLTPERNGSERGTASGSQTPTGSRRRSNKHSAERSLEMWGSQRRCLRAGAEDDQDDEDDKENIKAHKRVCVRLFSPSGPEEREPGCRTKRPYHASPTEGDMEAPDPVSVISFQRLKSRRKSSHTSIPDIAVSEQHLIGDFSKHYVLPVENADHQDLHCVSAQTVASLIRGQFSSVVEDFLIIDCRYPYEYQGGHIKGAVNLYTESQIHQAFLKDSTTSPVSPGASGERTKPSVSPGEGETTDGGSSERKLIVFHCEFSSARGPKLCQYLRKLDRNLNAQVYPHLFYPELYLLQGGYKNFYTCCPELCEPRGYVSMRHRDYREQLQYYGRTRRSHRRRRPIRSQQSPARSPHQGQHRLSSSEASGWAEEA